MKKRQGASDESVREALENLYRGTVVEVAMDMIMREQQEDRSRSMLASFLTGRLSAEFLRLNTHVPVLGCVNEKNNEEAVINWAHKKLRESPEQLRELTSEFMVDCYQELTEILIENQYL